MKVLIGIIVVTFLIIGPSPALIAGGGPAVQVQDVSAQKADIMHYRTDVGNKAARGTKNVLFGWTELPKRVVDVTRDSKNPIWGLLAGGFQGALKAMARTASGIVDIATAPIAPGQPPLMQPDISVE